ncbi:MAG: hypothetical protein IJV69_04005 [Kiritimatiellae bacterium]|nr:hypothetical protein [Kiritimatiellia bacterium]
MEATIVNWMRILQPAATPRKVIQSELLAVVRNRVRADALVAILWYSSELAAGTIVSSP